MEKDMTSNIKLKFGDRDQINMAQETEAIIMRQEVETGILLVPPLKEFEITFTVTGTIYRKIFAKNNIQAKEIAAEIDIDYADGIDTISCHSIKGIYESL